VSLILARDREKQDFTPSHGKVYFKQIQDCFNPVNLCFKEIFIGQQLKLPDYLIRN
jgi:hypothetical protein